MELKHYLSYLQNTITNKWSDLAMKDLDGATQYTYGELAAQIARLHTTFRLLGIKEGDKIALCGRNCSNWGVTFLAVETYKAVAVSILPDFTGEGVEALVNHSEAKLLYAGPNVLKKIDAKNMPGLMALVFMDDFSLQFAATEEVEKVYAQVDSAFAAEYPNGYSKENVNYPTDNHDDLALLNYTSGSTGNPKGVMITHKNLSGNIDFACKKIPHNPGDKVMSMLPIAHMFGLMFEFLYQVCDGAEVYFLTKAPTPTTLMKAFAQVHPFMILTVPLVIEKIIKDCMGQNLYNGLKQKLNGNTLTVQFVDDESSSFHFDGNTNVSGIKLSAINMESNHLMHEMFHAYQAYQETPETYSNSVINLEIEAHYAQYLYLKKLPEYPGSKWSIEWAEEGRPTLTTSLEFYITHKGELIDDKDGTRLNVHLNKLINAFKKDSVYSGYNYDGSRQGLSNFQTLQILTKGC